MPAPGIVTSALTTSAAFAALAFAVALVAPAGARADAGASFTYDADVVWSTAVRLLRVDLGYSYMGANTNALEVYKSTAAENEVAIT